MKKLQKAELTAEVTELAGKLKKWREQGRHGGRIPEGLWTGAVKAAHRHGVYRISRALRLDYYQLKRRTVAGGEEQARQGEGDSMFEELRALACSSTEARCVVELEKGNGAKLRVSVSDGATVDWCRVKEAFLGA